MSGRGDPRVLALRAGSACKEPYEWQNPRVHVVVLAGGYGGSRFVAGVRDLLRTQHPTAHVTVVANTADDIWVHGLRVCPDLDTIMYFLGEGLDRERGWGRVDESFVVSAELAAYGVAPDWFGLGDRDIGTHLVRRQLLDAGQPLSRITAALCTRWQPGVDLLPMSDDRAETHVVIEVEGQRRAIHFQEWWIRLRAGVPALGFPIVGIESTRPAPGVLEAIAEADAILLAPSNPVVSLGPILAVRGIREALRDAPGQVVGVSPIVGGSPVRGMADACLSAIGVPCTASGVAAHLAPRRLRVPAGAPGPGVLDGWIVDAVDAQQVGEVEALGIACRAVPSLMTDAGAARGLAAAALALAGLSQ